MDVCAQHDQAARTGPIGRKKRRSLRARLCCFAPAVTHEELGRPGSPRRDGVGTSAPGAADSDLACKGSKLPTLSVQPLSSGHKDTRMSRDVSSDSTSSGMDTPPVSPRSDRGEQPPPCAMSLDRPYTVEDWHTMMAHIREHGSEVFYDARSYASSTNSADSGVDQLGDGPAAAASTSRGAAARQAASAAIPRSLVPKGAAAPWTPQPALEWADPSWEYRPVDARAFYGFWRKCPIRSSQAPLTTNIALGLNSLQCKVIESITRLQLYESDDRRCLELVALPDFYPFPSNIGYVEKFPLDSSDGRWALRRDVPTLGRSRGQVYMTTDNILVLRVFSSGVFSRTTEWLAEDFMRLEDGGQTMVALMSVVDFSSGRRASQIMVANRG